MDIPFCRGVVSGGCRICPIKLETNTGGTPLSRALLYSPLALLYPPLALLSGDTGINSL